MIITEETTIEIVETIELTEAEEEILVLVLENKGISYLLTLVCCHNTITSIERILTPPTAAFIILDNRPFFDSANPQSLSVKNNSPLINISVTENP